MDRPPLPSADLGLTWRPLTPDDVPAWLELQRAIEDADRARERYDADDLLEELTVGSHKSAERDSLVGVDADGRARAFGLNDLLPGESLRRSSLFGGVHPQWRGRGIGRELLRWQRDQSRWALAEQERSTTTDPLPWRVLVSHPERLEANNALARRLGFQPVRWFHDMVRDLGSEDAPPVPEVPVPAPLRLASWTEDLDEAVRLAHNEAFAGHWGSQPRSREAWQQFGIGHRNARRDWSFVVLDPTREEDHPAVAAYTLSSAYTQDWQAQGYTQGWTALLGVRPHWRGRRLAPALLAAALRAFAADGMDKAGLDVDTGNASGALRLYESMGYRVEHTSIMWAVEGTGSAAC